MPVCWFLPKDLQRIGEIEAFDFFGVPRVDEIEEKG